MSDDGDHCNLTTHALFLNQSLVHDHANRGCAGVVDEVAFERRGRSSADEVAGFLEEVVGLVRI